MKSRSFTVVVYKEDDMYIAECPEVGTVDQGETIEQAVAGLKKPQDYIWKSFLYHKQLPDISLLWMLAMPRLPRISSKKAIKALERLGFEQIRRD